MDTFVDSSWYFLRYLDATNPNSICSPDKAKDLPVDVYIGGIEHAILHLLYARFITHFLHEEGVSPVCEPFKRLLTQGLVNGQTYVLEENGKFLLKSEVKELNGNLVHAETGQAVTTIWAKMSKSKHNGVDPLDILAQYGADTARLFILFKAPPELDLNWDEKAIQGVSRWLTRVWSLVDSCVSLPQAPLADQDGCKALVDVQMATNNAINHITNTMSETYAFNTVVAELMKLSNTLKDYQTSLQTASPQYTDCVRTFLVLLSPLAPHISCELWERMSAIKSDWSNPLDSVLNQKWPTPRPVKQLQQSIPITIQIDGKFRGRVEVPLEIHTAPNINSLVDMNVTSDLFSFLTRSDVCQKWLPQNPRFKRVVIAKEGTIINFLLDKN